MDIFLIIIGLIFCILGIIGSFSPIIPGPITSWVGLFVIHFTSIIPFDIQFLIITFLVAVSIFIIDLLIPIIGLKKFGGTRKGLIGATVGLLIGLFLAGPIGLIGGSFLGAVSGEYTSNKSLKKSLKPAIGTFIGIISGTIIKFLVATLFLVLYFYLVYTNLFS